MSIVQFSDGHIWLAQDLCRQCSGPGGELRNVPIFETEAGQVISRLSDPERLKMALCLMEVQKPNFGVGTCGQIIRQILQTRLRVGQHQVKEALAFTLRLLQEDHVVFVYVGQSLLEALNDHALLEWSNYPELQQGFQTWLDAQEQVKDYTEMFTTGFLNRKVAAEFASLLGLTRIQQLFTLSAWREEAQAFLKRADGAEIWKELFPLLQVLGKKEPSQKWKKQVKVHLENHPEALLLLLDLMERWLNPGTHLGSRGKEEVFLLTQEQENLLRAMFWVVALGQTLQGMQLLADTAAAAYQKIPGTGPRNQKLGNTCVNALLDSGSIHAFAHVEKMRQGTRNGTIRRFLDGVLEKAAASRGLTRQDLLELSIPELGFAFSDQGSSKEEQIGDTTITLHLKSGHVEVSYQDSTGRTLAQPTRSTRNECKAELASFRKQLKDLQGTLQSLKRHLEQQYLQNRHWTFESWLERFDRHPLWRSVTRNLIWQVDGMAVRWDEGWMDAHGQRLDLTPGRIELWHPVFSTAEEVQAWRRHILERDMVQPFKQAFREVYLLTAAEETTRIYSNRFAAHILKQHQLQVLAQERGWRYHLQGGWDSHNNPTREISAHGLTVDYFLEGIPDQISSSGIYLYVSTDQVRFYPSGRWQDPMELKDIPAVVFSEIMRDVDLFVGVCSVGNDPSWTHNPDGYGHTHADYWQQYSFGELSATAETRRDLLAHLLPRLKIHNRAEISGRFLRVRGQLKTYKIHLGSGNILMEPNDQYLCIVPAGRQEKEVPLAFEGDRMFSVILSKALMLSQDHTIKDPTILAQLRR